MDAAVKEAMTDWASEPAASATVWPTDFGSDVSVSRTASHATYQETEANRATGEATATAKTMIMSAIGAR